MSKTNEASVAQRARNGGGQLSPADVERLYGDGYREVEVLPDGSIRQSGGEAHDDTVTRTLKTERTWY
jgi:hypothetical protein